VSIGFVSGASGVKSLEVRFEAAAIDRLKSIGAEFCAVNTGIFRFSVDQAAISELDAQTTGIVTFSAMPVTRLSAEAKAAIGSRPVFDFTVKDAAGKTVTSYGEGSITRGIRYTAASTEKPGSLFTVKVVDGKPQYLTHSSYTDGWMIWSGDSNSVYGVAYKAPAPAFSDTANHWAKEHIDFAASRGLIAGTSGTRFSPNTAITRADFLMALGKLSGANVSGTTRSSFSDVPNTNPAMPYIEWAVKNGIVQGIGGGKFAPDSPITREAMAVMMVNYAKATGYTLPVSRQAVTFADNASISAWAKTAVKAIQQTGVIVGRTGNRFDPQGNMTRGEAATILRRFVELVIDEGTARGWVQNDSGQWQYIGENGRAVTGWLTLDGDKYWFDANGVMASGKCVQISGKWYYFQADGTLAVNTTIDGYAVGADGIAHAKER
jgi:glucan-binding repeat-containing protein